MHVPYIPRVQSYRWNQRMTQEQLAHTMGISRRALCAIETGKSEPSLMLALKLARYFHVSVEELFVFKDR